MTSQTSAGDLVVTPSVIAVSLARHWRAMLGVPGIGGILMVALLLIWPPTYTSSATMAPETRQTVNSQLAGLAAIVGVLPATGGQQSPQFYADLLRSRPIVHGVLLSKFQDPVPSEDGARPDSASLLDLMEVKARQLEGRVERASEILRDKIQVSVDVRTGVIALSVQNRYPELAAAIANAFIEQLAVYNRDVRQSQARARRIFIEHRATEAQRALAESEEELRRFLEQNRSSQSPSLQFERERLERRVNTTQELYLNLQRQFDAARIEEVNDLPVITVIERPEVPTIRSAPRRRVLLGVFLVLSTMVTAAGAVGYDIGREGALRGIDALRARVRPLLPRLVSRWI